MSFIHIASKNGILLQSFNTGSKSTKYIQALMQIPFKLLTRKYKKPLSDHKIP